MFSTCVSSFAILVLFRFTLSSRNFEKWSMSFTHCGPSKAVRAGVNAYPSNFLMYECGRGNAFHRRAVFGSSVSMLRTLFVPENVVTSLRTKPITVMVVDMSIYPLNTSIAPAPNKVAVTNSTVPFQTR